VVARALASDRRRLGGLYFDCLSRNALHSSTTVAIRAASLEDQCETPIRIRSSIALGYEVRMACSSSFVRHMSVVVVVAALSAIGLTAQTRSSTDPDAVFNVQSKIYHQAACASARRCTKNCVVMKLSEARKRGGRACLICGGPTTARNDSGRDQDMATGVSMPLSLRGEGPWHQPCG
jgi:hypothetical protein